MTPEFGGNESHFLRRHTMMLHLQAAGNSYFAYCTYPPWWPHQIAIFNDIHHGHFGTITFDICLLGERRQSAYL